MKNNLLIVGGSYLRASLFGSISLPFFFFSCVPFELLLLLYGYDYFSTFLFY